MPDSRNDPALRESGKRTRTGCLCAEVRAVTEKETRTMFLSLQVIVGGGLLVLSELGSALRTLQSRSVHCNLFQFATKEGLIDPGACGIATSCRE